MSTRYAMAASTAALVTSIGLALNTAVDQTTGRQAIGAAADPTSQHGQLIVRVDAGGADVTALAAVDPGTTGQVLTVGDGGVPVWRDPAAGGDTYPVEMVSGVEGDWTTSNTSPAGSSVSVAAGVVTVTFASGGSCDFTSGGCATNAARAQRSIPHYDAASWSVRARLASVTSSAYFVPMFGVMTGTVWSTASAKYVIYFASNSDNLTFARIAASGATIGGATVASIRGGQGWLRLDCAGRTIVAYGGVGSGGAEPTAWTIISSVAITATDPMPQRLFMSAHDSSATPAQTITWDLVRLQAVQ